MEPQLAALFHRWLGLPPADADPNHYEVLGLTVLETDLQVVQFIASWRRGFLKQKLADGLTEVTPLIASLQRAEDVLTDLNKKAKYDLALRQRFPSWKAPAAQTCSPDDGWRRWLGIVWESSEPIPDHRLLGLAPDETDLTVIKNACDQRIEPLRTIERETGAEQHQATELLKALFQARRRLEHRIKEAVKSSLVELDPAISSPSPTDVLAEWLPSEITPPSQQWPPKFLSSLSLFLMGTSRSVRSTSIAQSLSNQYQRLRARFFEMTPSRRRACVIAAASAIVLLLSVPFLVGPDADNRDLETVEDETTDATTADDSAESKPGTPMIGLKNADFEDGLTGWTLERGAMNFVVFGEEGQKVLTTYGKQKDATMGRISQTFQVPKVAKSLNFLASGGNGSKVRIALNCDGKTVQRTAARNSNKPFGVSWDLSPLRGKSATLEIVDDTKARWGFIAIRGIKIVTEPSTESEPPKTATATTPKEPPTPREQSLQFLGKDLAINGSFEKVDTAPKLIFPGGKEKTGHSSAYDRICEWEIVSGKPIVVSSEGRFKPAHGKLAVFAIADCEFMQDVSIEHLNLLIDEGTLAVKCNARVISLVKLATEVTGPFGKQIRQKRVFDPDSTLMSLEFRQDLNGTVLGAISSPPNSSTTWSSLEVGFTVPPKTRWLRIRLSSQHTYIRNQSLIWNTEGGVLFDQVSLTAALATK